MRRLLSSVPRLVIAGSVSGMLVACASGGVPTPDEHSPTDRIVAVDANGSAIHTNDYYSGTDARIHASPASVMAVLSEIYPDLGIPIGTMVTATGQIGNTNYRVPGHALKKMPLSRILQCGQESQTGSRADADAITLEAISTIKPAGDSGSVVSTYVSAIARPFGTSSDPVTCQSSGVLEGIINERLAKALGGSTAGSTAN
jgi:hypothetical protein